MKKSLHLFVFVLALSCAFALAQQSTVGQSTDQNTKDHSINPEQAQSQDMNSGKSKPMVDDQALHKQIQDQLASNPAFSGVQVEVENGTAKLTGTVASKDDKKKAKEMAKSVSGVKKVKEDLTVQAGAMNNSSGSMNQSSMGAASSDQSQNTAGSISGNAGASSPTPSTSTPSSTTPSTSTPDSSTTPNSSTSPNPPQSASAASDNAAGSTTASDTMAQSTAPSTSTPDASAAEAGNVAAPQSSQSSQSTTGMQSSTAPSTSQAAGSSDQVKSDIQTALRNEPTLTSSSITVDVTDDSIQLNGSASSAKERDEAKRIAQSFAGNRRVVDNVKVSGSSSNPSDMSNPSPNAAPGSSTPGTTPNSSSTPNSTNPEQPSVPKN